MDYFIVGGLRKAWHSPFISRAHGQRSLLEMQAILVELIENFEFHEDEKATIQRVPSGLMIPMVNGRMHEGTQLPLKVSLRR
jgi:hypothetical protein